MTKETKKQSVVKLSSAESAIFQQLDAQVKQIQQQQIDIMKSIIDSRDIDAESIEGDVSLLPDFSGVTFLLAENGTF